VCYLFHLFSSCCDGEVDANSITWTSDEIYLTKMTHFISLLGNAETVVPSKCTIKAGNYFMKQKSNKKKIACLTRDKNNKKNTKH